MAEQGFGIGDLIKGGAEGLLNGLGDSIAKVTKCFKADPTEAAHAQAELDQMKMNIQTKLSEMALEAERISASKYTAMLADTASARDMTVKVEDSEKASWLAKNISYLIDIFVLLIWGILTVYILGRMLNLIAKDDKVDFTGVLAMWGGVTALATTIINFHRGSSKGSEDKSKVIHEMAQQNSNQ